MTSAAVVLLALLADVALGDPPNAWHPVAWLGRGIDRGRRAMAGGRRPWLLVGGAVLVGAACALAAVTGLLLGAAAVRLGSAGLLVEALALKATLSVRGLVAAAAAVAAALERGDLLTARALVGRHLVSRPTGDLDEAGVSSAAIESVAENLTDSVVAPLLWYLAFGVAGAAAYRAANTADAMLGYRQGELESLGKVAARLDDLLNLLPARLAAGALVLAAPLAGGRAWSAAHVAWRDAGLTASPNAGWTMAAMAGALGLTLEKRGYYRLGGARRPAASDIRRAIRIVPLATLVVLAGILTGLAVTYVAQAQP